MILTALCSSARAQDALSLAEAIAIAKHHRADVMQAELGILTAKLNVLQAGLERFQLTIQASFTPQLQDNNINGPQRLCTLQQDICQKYDLPVNASIAAVVPLFNWGLTEAHLLSARALERAARQQKQATVEQVALETAHAYWAVRRAELVEAIIVASIARNQETEEATRVRAASGITPSVDYQRAHLLVLRQRAELELMRGQLSDARAQLARALELDPAIVLTEDPVRHRPPSLPPLATQLREAESQRAELRGQREQLEAQRWTVHAAWAALGPQLNAVFQGSGNLQPFTGLDAANPAGIERRFVMQGYLGLQLQWTIFDSSLLLKLRAAQYQNQSLIIDMQKLQYQVSSDVASARARLVANGRQAETLEQSLELARTILEGLRKRYKVGSALLLEVLNAQADLLQVELDLLDSRIGMATAEADLQAALGTL